MKRIFILLILLVLAISGLVSCGENEKLPKTVTVSFNPVIDFVVIESVKINYKEKIEEVGMQKVEGKIFLGWYLDDEKFDFNQEITEDITLTAKWKIAQLFEVTYDYNYEGHKEILTFYEEEKLPIPETPKREGFIFLGWYLNDELFDFSSELYEDITLIALWEESEIALLKVKDADNLTFDLDEFRISDIKLEVTFNDGTVKEIEARKEMLSDYDFETMFLTGAYYIYFEYGGKRARTQINLTSDRQQSTPPKVIIYALKEIVNGYEAYTFYSAGDGDLASLEIELLTKNFADIEEHIEGLFGYKQEENKLNIFYSFGKNINGNNKLFSITGVEGFSLKYVSENSYVYKYLNDEVTEEKEVRYYFR